MEKANNEATELFRIDPKFTVSGWNRKLIAYWDRAGLDKVAGLLIDAGLPE